MTTQPRENLVVLVLLALLIGCQGDSGRLPTEPPSPPPSPPSNAGIVLEGRGYPNSWGIGVVGTTVSDHTFAVATHDGKSLVPGVQIIWTVSGSGGSISPTTDTTNTVRGYDMSVATLTLGPDEGMYTVTATAPTLPGTPSVTFQATAVTVMVQIRDLADGGFVPASVTVPSGRSVGWRYASGEGDVHNVTFEDDPTRPVSSRDFYDITGGAPLHHSRLLQGSPRTIRYRCTHHSTSFADGEVGTVTVQ